MFGLRRWISTGSERRPVGATVEEGRIYSMSKVIVKVTVTRKRVVKIRHR